MDAIGMEPHFVSHIAPVWHALPESVRGRFLVETRLLDHAHALGIDAEPMSGMDIRRKPQAGPRPHGDRPALVASIGDTKVGRRLGYGPFVRLEHGAGQAYRHDRTGSYAGGPGNEDAALILCPNEYSADHWRRAYPRASVAVVGCPKLDHLPARGVSAPPSVIAVSWHWPGPGYAGTAWGEYRRALPALAERFTVIGHEHPNWQQRRLPGSPSKTYAQLGIPFVEDFEDVCRQADIYVADNTSTLFEFAATGRPVVVVNSRAWSRKVDHGLRFWSAAHVGVNVDTPDMLVSAVMAGLADDEPAKANREDALSIVYAYRSGAAERAAAAISEWIVSRQAVAA